MPHIIRTSDRKTFKNCRQQWDFGSKIRMNLEPKTTDKHLAFGTAIHAALEKWYEPESWNMPRSPMRDLAFSAFSQSLRETMDPTHDEFQDLMELGFGMLRHYFEWAPEHDKFVPEFTELEFEVPIGFNCECHGEPVLYQGRVDGLVRDENHYHWILEHKTAGRFEQSLEWLSMDEQCGSYVWALQQKLGIRIEGVIYNELLKEVPHPPHKLVSGQFSKDKRQNTTYNLYLQTLRDAGYNTVLYQDILGFLREQGNKFFRRVAVHRSQRELELLGERIATEAREIVDPNVAIYPNPSRFLCARCSFKSPCIAKMDGSDYQWLLNDLYTVRESN